MAGIASFSASCIVARHLNGSLKVFYLHMNVAWCMKL